MSRLLDDADEFEDVPAIDAHELDVRRAFALDAAGVAPGGHAERLATRLGVTVPALRAHLGWGANE